MLCVFAFMPGSSMLVSALFGVLILLSILPLYWAPICAPGIDQRSTATSEPEGRPWSILYQGAVIKTYSLSAWAEPIAICLDAFFGMSEEGSSLRWPSYLTLLQSILYQGAAIRFSSLRTRKVAPLLLFAPNRAHLQSLSRCLSTCCVCLHLCNKYSEQSEVYTNGVGVSRRKLWKLHVFRPLVVTAAAN